MRDFITALLSSDKARSSPARRAIRSFAIRTPVPGFDSHGNLGQQALEAAYDELSGK